MVFTIPSLSRTKEHVFIFCKKNRTEIALFFLSLFVFGILFFCTNIRYPNDDQFILYRYIDHIAFGNGFVYNLGEKVLGSTTPLFTLVAAFAKYVFPSLPTPDIVAYINILILSFSSCFVYRVSRYFISNQYAFLASLIFIFNLSRAIPEGMESPLFILLLLVFLDQLLRKKYEASAVSVALMLLTRPDAGLIAILVACFWLQKEGWKKTIRLVLISVLVALPWLIFATFYFGSFVPQSLLTKTYSHDIYNLAPLQATKIQASHLSRIYWGKLFDPENIPLQITFNLLPFCFLIACALWKKGTRDTWIFFAIPFLYFVSFAASNPIIFPWYLSQMEPLWIILSVIGFASLAKERNPYWVRVVFMCALLVGPLFFWGSQIITKNTGTKINAFRVGEFIRTHMRPGDRVGLADIGIVGYTSGAYIIDFIGLVRYESVFFYPIQNSCASKTELYVVPPALIRASQPEWLVAGDNSLDPCFVKESWFRKKYAMVYVSGGAKVWWLKK